MGWQWYGLLGTCQAAQPELPSRGALLALEALLEGRWLSWGCSDRFSLAELGLPGLGWAARGAGTPSPLAPVPWQYLTLVSHISGVQVLILTPATWTTAPSAGAWSKGWALSTDQLQQKLLS